VNVADAIVVGGGPAGSSCAWKLRNAGLEVLVLDRMAFPRTKLCAGWVTPEAIADLELDTHDYPRSIMTFDELHLHWKALTVKLKAQQHSIRRFEFDEFLLQRSGARVLQHKVREIRRDGSDYIVDGQFRCKYLVGAGGTACPVYKTLFHERNPRSSILQTATFEQEFSYDWEDARCHLWFFDDGLPGYAWYVPKANGYINVRYEHYDPTGYSYYLRGNVDVISGDNAYIVGDSVGLATRDMCEGIGPAVKSGLLAARAITTGADYSLAGINKVTGSGFASKLLERKFVAAQ
jgi:flavin-dependent dehydrogenase